VGADVTFKLLAVCSVEQALEPLRDEPLEPKIPPIRSGDTLKDALLAMVAFGQPTLPVVNGGGILRGQITLHGLQQVVANQAQSHPVEESKPSTASKA